MNARLRSVVVVVGEMKLRRDDVRVLHLLVIVDREWTLRGLSRELHNRYGGEWYREKVGRCIGKLRRNGLVESEGYDTVRDAVCAVSEMKTHNPSTGVLWSEIYAVLKKDDDDIYAVLKKMLEDALGKR